jgi:flagellar biogenesis protein FliO
MGLLQQCTLRFAGRARELFRAVRIRRRERTLRLCETVSLGDKRFVAVVQFERRRFLLGVTPQTVSLLQGLGEEEPATADRPSSTYGGVA